MGRVDEEHGERMWRWRVWHDDDAGWHAELQRRAERQLRLLDGGSTERESGCVPKIVHHIWLGSSPIPAACAEWMKSWQEHHPEWTHRVWRDADAEAFGLRNKRAFDAACNYGEKSDILRYEILYRLGGVYVDVDMLCLQSIDKLLSHFSFIVGMSNTGCVETNNAFIGAAPGHPILARLIEKIERQSSQPQLDASAFARIVQFGGGDVVSLLSTSNAASAMATIERTGPGLMTRTFMEAVGWASSSASPRDGFLSSAESEHAVALPVDFLFPLRNDARPQHPATFPPQALAVHFWQRSWMS